jgi:thiamine pyrophosphokinase
MRVVIVANGNCDDPAEMRRFLTPDTLIIAADGGTRHVQAARLMPDLIVGDLDSLADVDVESLEQRGVELIQSPSQKDETDLELALLQASRMGATEILVFAALGGRLDQEIANLMLLTLPEIRDIPTRLVQGNQVAFVIRPSEEGAMIRGTPGDTVSLIPLAGDAVGVITDGLEWPLRNERLLLGPARGVSNVLLESRGRVWIEEGLLLCVVIRNRAPDS